MRFQSLVLLLFCLAFPAIAQEKAASAVPFPANPVLPSIFLVGDSTANNHGDPNVPTKNTLGWGTPFAQYFDLAKVNVVNAARAGRSSRTFLSEGLWDKVAAQLKPGDVVLIQFGHNDGGPIDDKARARGSLHGIGEESQEIDNPVTGKREVVRTFGWYLREMIRQTKEKGATPIVLSPTPNNVWQEGKIERGFGHYTEWAAEVAQQEQRTDFVDANAIISDEYERLGAQKVMAFFPGDHTHTSPAGAEVNADCVVAGLKSLLDAPVTRFLSAKGQEVLSSTERAFKTPANASLPTLWIIGDSTVRNGDGVGAHGLWGWGDKIAPYFNQQKINVVNRAVGGLSSRTYYTQYWPRLRSMLKPGDFVLMQFGHNDGGPLDDQARARGSLPGIGEETQVIQNPHLSGPETVHTYGWYLRQFVAEARTKGAAPILCSLVPRNVLKDGKIRREAYADWASEVAAVQKVPFLDINAILAAQYDRMGEPEVIKLFGDKTTHTTEEGAIQNAKAVVAALKSLRHDPLAKDLSPEGKQIAALGQR